MKILYFGGGLGNQIFEYAFYLSVKEKFKSHRIWGIYDDKRFKEHIGGFEIEKIFNVEFPQTSKTARIVMFCIMVWNKFIHKTSLYCHNLTKPNYNAIVFNAFKMNKVFYEHRHDWICFKPLVINDRNKSIVQEMNRTLSVAIHVRRGDFLSSKYAAKHANVATIQYYQAAIEYVRTKFVSPKFFVFSDDIKWCKESLLLPDATFVDWNVGNESYIDMYLMTRSKAIIIANSTFSYWGAYLNNNNPIVIYPEKWKTSEAEYLDIFPETWISMGT